MQLPADANAPLAPPPIPIRDETVLAFERALLTPDAAARLRELTAAIANDSDAASWALAAAEFRLGRTINRMENAAAWLNGCLEAELATSLRSDVAEGTPDTLGEISARLPLLVTRLQAVVSQEAEFQQRLEHEKLESLKELAYGASHEINNPLANIAGDANIARG